MFTMLCCIFGWVESDLSAADVSSLCSGSDLVLSPRSDRGNLYYKSEVLQCICECFSPGDGTYGNNAYLDLDKQLPFLCNHPRLVGVEADT